MPRLPERHETDAKVGSTVRRTVPEDRQWPASPSPRPVCVSHEPGLTARLMSDDVAFGQAVEFAV
jgi:hypothetical protein